MKKLKFLWVGLPAMFAVGAVLIANPVGSQEVEFDRWVDANGHCPATCDPEEWDCPCAIIE